MENYKLSIPKFQTLLRERYRRNLLNLKIVNDNFNIINILAIAIKEKNHETGTKIMRDIISFADANNKYIVLEVNPFVGGNEEIFSETEGSYIVKLYIRKLYEFYKRFDFFKLSMSSLSEIKNLELQTIIQENFIHNHKKIMLRIPNCS